MLTAVSIVAAVAMQAVAGEWFPPPVSVSQYGVGPWGWMFSVFVVTMAAAPLVLERCSPRRPRIVRTVLWIGFLGALVMAVVRTDSGGAQASVNAKVHMVGSIVSLAFVPLGILMVLWMCGRAARVVGLLEIALVEVSIGLLLAAASGFDTAGLGAARSWAFWQAVASVACIVMVLTMAAVLMTSGRADPSRNAGHGPRENHTPTATPSGEGPSILVQE